jgi:hypothetical protein
MAATESEWGMRAGRGRRLVCKGDYWVQMGIGRIAAIYPINRVVPPPRDIWGSCM